MRAHVWFTGCYLSRGECCGSCHEDDMHGYQIGDIEPPGARRSGRIVATACCLARERMQGWTRSDWAKAIRSDRAAEREAKR